jgi:uncharacterized protein (DUF2384 family)
MRVKVVLALHRIADRVNRMIARETEAAWDRPLSEEERARLQKLAVEIAGASWLDEPNVRLGGQTPAQCLKENRGHLVRDLLNSLRYIGVS